MNDPWLYKQESKEVISTYSPDFIRKSLEPVLIGQSEINTLIAYQKEIDALMNREIKFRAWENENARNKMFEWDIVKKDITSWLNCKDTICMQYTGLKDKNRVEIYEGDLLRIPAKSDWEKINFEVKEVFFHDNDSANNHVGWQMNRTHCHGALCGGTEFHSFLPKYTALYEVIGNIYQNPELLK